MTNDNKNIVRNTESNKSDWLEWESINEDKTTDLRLTDWFRIPGPDEIFVACEAILRQANTNDFVELNH
ncbi:hypothetical protein PV326_000259 [Microctonus aethiopoides]|nr:hypothetical protein PV326_000259 [Microctonus aethiopoides]